MHGLFKGECREIYSFYPYTAQGGVYIYFNFILHPCTAQGGECKGDVAFSHIPVMGVFNGPWDSYLFSF